MRGVSDLLKQLTDLFYFTLHSTRSVDSLQSCQSCLLLILLCVPQLFTPISGPLSLLSLSGPSPIHSITSLLLQLFSYVFRQKRSVALLGKEELSELKRTQEKRERESCESSERGKVLTTLPFHSSSRDRNTIRSVQRTFTLIPLL